MTNLGSLSSKRTESFWSRTTLFDGDRAVAEVLLHQGVFKASYADYPTAEAGAVVGRPAASQAP